MTAELKASRDGSVWRGDRCVGYVDHFNPSRPSKKSHLWRAVHEDGRYHFGFTTRAQAIEWLVA